MKNTNIKNVIITLTLVIIALGSGYMLGQRNTNHVEAKTQTQIVRPIQIVNQNWWNAYCDSHVTITDWNTNGNQLSLYLSNGVELYADKTENIYVTRKQYIGFDEISDVSKADDGTITIIDANGNQYEIKVEHTF